MSNESFTEFKDSFSYGSRTDLNFKFLKSFSDDEAANFFQGLLIRLGQSVDDGDINRLIDHVVDSQIQGYREPTMWTYDEGPFAALSKPIGESRIGLLTSTGHFVVGHDPEPFGVKEMTQEEATERIQDFLKSAPTLSEIPLDTDDNHLQVRHGGYDIQGVLVDHNVALPLDRMLELDEEGIIGTALSPAYSFVGATAQMRLLSKTGPEWVEIFRQQDMDGMILVPV
ncbi:MAG: glycine/sarcosine/betaine reductase selenoprotein B family protein [Chloroflexota bacterium]